MIAQGDGLLIDARFPEAEGAVRTRREEAFPVRKVGHTEDVTRVPAQGA
jgi:hypothetical protein